MKYIEVSRKIKLSKKVSAQELKKAFVARLERTIEIETISDDSAYFKITGTTGTPEGITRHARLSLDINMSFNDDGDARILVSGTARTARSLTILYAFFFFLLMMVGLLPGSIETGYEASGAIDALVLLILGIYVTTDINKKLEEPKGYLETVLKSLDTTFS